MYKWLWVKKKTLGDHRLVYLSFYQKGFFRYTIFLTHSQGLPHCLGSTPNLKQSLTAGSAISASAAVFHSKNKVNPFLNSQKTLKTTYHILSPIYAPAPSTPPPPPMVMVPPLWCGVGWFGFCPSSSCRCSSKISCSS